MPIDTKDFHVIIQKDKEAVVLLKRELYISDILDDVTAILIKFRFSGTVVFDMVLIKGTDTHYYNMKFNDSTFDYQSNRVLVEPSIGIIRMSKTYYKEHLEYIYSSTLTDGKKKSILKWIEES